MADDPKQGVPGAPKHTFSLPMVGKVDMYDLSHPVRSASGGDVFYWEQRCRQCAGFMCGNLFSEKVVHAKCGKCGSVNELRPRRLIVENVPRLCEKCGVPVWHEYEGKDPNVRFANHPQGGLTRHLCGVIV